MDQNNSDEELNDEEKKEVKENNESSSSNDENDSSEDPSDPKSQDTDSNENLNEDLNKDPDKDPDINPDGDPESQILSENELPTLDENLQKLISPEERKQMEKNLDLVVSYLDDIGIVDMNIDREKLIITVPFDYEEFTFLSHIVLSPEWILIKTSIFEIEALTDMAIMELFAEVLKGNFILNSVVYALDAENKSLWAQADVPITADFDTFKLSYFSIVFAIDYFMKNISPKIDLQLKSTMDREKFESNPSNLYI